MVTRNLLLALLLLTSGHGIGRRREVNIAAFQFQPGVIYASVGDTIVWRNSDIVPHTARARDGSWDSGNIAAKGQQRTVVRKKGEQTFACLYHSNMKGKLIVRH